MQTSAQLTLSEFLQLPGTKPASEFIDSTVRLAEGIAAMLLIVNRCDDRSGAPASRVGYDRDKLQRIEVRTS